MQYLRVHIIKKAIICVNFQRICLSEQKTSTLHKRQTRARIFAIFKIICNCTNKLYIIVQRIKISLLKTFHNILNVLHTFCIQIYKRQLKQHYLLNPFFYTLKNNQCRKMTTVDKY